MAAGPDLDLRALYDAHRDAVWNAALHLCGDAASAEDLVHDVFVGLLRSPPLRIDRPRAYLLAAVVHRSRDRLRRRGRDGDGAELDALPAELPPVDAQALAAERTDEVRRALAALPLEQREVCVLHVFEGLSFREIGQLCGINQNTAASRWRYAAARLQALLGQGARS